jgi:hypothetical protein
MTEIEKIWKAEAIERMADDERCIGMLRARIEELEDALRKNRNTAWAIYYGSGVMLRVIDEPDAKPKISRNK